MCEKRIDPGEAENNFGAGLDGLYEEIPFQDAQQFLAFIASQQLRSSTWVFRGQTNANCPLRSSLERFASKLFASPVEQSLTAESIEGHHFREFRRRASHYTTTHLDDDNLLEWLAMMRHHGSPSRLLDFSRSPYVAAFFATAEAKRNDSVAIWAVDARELKYLSAKALLGESADYVNVGKACLENPAYSLTDPRVFSALVGGADADATVKRSGPVAAVIFPVEPRFVSERMLLQQSLFLFPTSVMCGFQRSLRNVMERAVRWIHEGKPEERVLSNIGGSRMFIKEYVPEKRVVVYKLILSPAAHPDILRELDRMGLNYASLVPGLDGLARSLTTVSQIRANDRDYGTGLY